MDLTEGAPQALSRVPTQASALVGAGDMQEEAQQEPQQAQQQQQQPGSQQLQDSPDCIDLTLSDDEGAQAQIVPPSGREDVIDLTLSDEDEVRVPRSLEHAASG